MPVTHARYLFTLAITIAAGIFVSACASTGGTPHPFPMPAGPVRPPTASTESPLPDSATAEASRPAAKPSTLVATALALRGVPYRNGGSTLDGFDCSGFTQYVFARHGLMLPREVREQYKVGRSVSRRRVEPGDLVFFTTTSRGPTHVGIIVNEDEFVHAPSSRGVVRIEHLSASYWAKRFVGVRRVDAR